MSEPDWKAELRWTVEAFAATNFRGHQAPDSEVRGVMSRYLMGALLPHIEAAYQRGLQAGRSQAGYSTRRKSKEGPCRTGTAGAAGSIPASPTGES